MCECRVCVFVSVFVSVVCVWGDVFCFISCASDFNTHKMSIVIIGPPPSETIQILALRLDHSSVTFRPFKGNNDRQTDRETNQQTGIGVNRQVTLTKKCPYQNILHVADLKNVFQCQ